jgi:hypothetical protein
MAISAFISTDTRTRLTHTLYSIRSDIIIAAENSIFHDVVKSLCQMRPTPYAVPFCFLFAESLRA